MTVVVNTEGGYISQLIGKYPSCLDNNKNNRCGQDTTMLKMETTATGVNDSARMCCETAYKDRWSGTEVV